MLHHLAPSISYTNFKELEIYLMETELHEYISNNTTTYFYAFKSLYKS